MKKLVTACAVAGLILSLSGQVRAEPVIFADTTGSDTYNTAEFYGIQFLSGSAADFVQSITYDISVDSNAFFDFSGGGSYGGQQEPVLGTLVGLSASDITFDLLDPQGGNALHPKRLRFNFASGSFGVGDSMRFAADTDSFVSAPTPGSAFGQAGASISATMFDGTSVSEIFARVSSSRSEATIVVPEPGAMCLLAVGGLATLRRRRKR